jgi:hypothetical protein
MRFEACAVFLSFAMVARRDAERRGGMMIFEGYDTGEIDGRRVPMESRARLIALGLIVPESRRFVNRTTLHLDPSREHLFSNVPDYEFEDWCESRDPEAA